MPFGTADIGIRSLKVLPLLNKILLFFKDDLRFTQIFFVCCQIQFEDLTPFCMTYTHLRYTV